MPEPIRAQRYSEVNESATEAGASQMAPTAQAPSKIAIADMMSDLGGAGTTLVNGFFAPDYNAKLAGTLGLDTFEKMYMSDAQIFATLSALELPIRSTQWFIDPVSGEDGKVQPVDDLIATFVEEALFERMEQSWDDFLRELCTMFRMGFSVHEKIYQADDEHVWLKGLESRKQRTIYRWETQEGQPGITQILPYMKVAGGNEGQNLVSIPASKLLIFSFRREGLYYPGQSVLRSAYQHWYMKQMFYKFDAVRHERMSLGLPIVTLPKSATAQDIAKAQAIVDRIRVNERAGLVLPDPDWKFEFPDMHANTTSGDSMWVSIEHHNREIAKNILAQFLEIGGHAGSGGSKSTSEDHSELFYLAENASAQQIADTMNRFCIPELVQLNFNGVTRFPKLKFKRIGKDKFAEVMKGLKDLVDARVIVPDDPLEEHMRDYLDLPAKPEESPARPVDKQEETTVENDTPDNTTDDPGSEDEDNTTSAPGEKVAAKECCPKHAYKKLSERIDNRAILRLMREASTTEDREKLKKKGFRIFKDEGRYWRPLTFAERKVRLPTIQDAFSRMAAKLDRGISGVTDAQKRLLMKQVRDALQSGDASKMPKIGVTASPELAKLLTDVRLEMFGLGKQTASTEMGVAVPPDAEGMADEFAKQHAGIADDLAAGMSDAARAAASDALTSGKGLEEGAQAAADAVDTAARQADALSTVMIQGSLNTGRSSVFERYPEQVYAMQWTSVLEDTTCDYCMSMDGVVMSAEEALADYDPPVHINCLPGDSLVLPCGRIAGSSERRYEGNLIVIRTASGKHVRCTPNHPILTSSGWKASHLLKVGENVLKIERMSTGDNHNQNVPARIEDLARSFSIASMTVPTSAPDFHGDGRDGNVAIIRSNGLLRKDVESSGVKPVSKPPLGRADMASIPLSAISRFHNGSEAFPFPADGIMSISDLTESLLRSHSHPFILEALTTPTDRDASEKQTSPDNGTANMIRLAQGEFGFPGEITTDAIISIDVEPFCSEVFNIHTEGGWYTTDSIIAHNCACVLVEILEDEAVKPDITGSPDGVPPVGELTDFEDIPAPIVEPDAPAADLINQEIKDRQEKIDQYTRDETYQNRVDSHQARIDDLLNSIGDEAFHESLKSFLPDIRWQK